MLELAVFVVAAISDATAPVVGLASAACLTPLLAASLRVAALSGRLVDALSAKMSPVPPSPIP